MKNLVEFAVRSGAAERQRGGCVIAGVFEARKLSPSAAALDHASRGFLTAVMRRGESPGKVGQTLLLHHVRGVAAERVLLVGGGRERELDEYKFRKMNAAAVETLRRAGAADAVSCLPELQVHDRDAGWKVRHSVESVLESVYVFDRLKSRKKDLPAQPLRRMTLMVDREDAATAAEGMRIGLAVAGAVRLARDLGNLPPNICTPTYLADQARELAATHRGLKVSVLKRAEIEKLGMGAFLAVARGSHEPPRLIIIEYRGGGAGAAPVALVGKGITFDTGGISIKPAAAMDEMKYDMCGAASVLGALQAAAELRLPLNLVGVIPATENMPGGSATRPADIVTTLSGQTVEILNTDAEGRLILCDAITYAEREYTPAACSATTSRSRRRCSRRERPSATAPGGCRRGRITRRRSTAISPTWPTSAAGARPAPSPPPVSWRGSRASCAGRISTSPAPPGARASRRGERAGRCRCWCSFCWIAAQPRSPRSRHDPRRFSYFAG